MYSEDELQRILQQARANNPDPKWLKWLDDLVREVRQLRAELDELIRRGNGEQPANDTKLL